MCNSSRLAKKRNSESCAAMDKTCICSVSVDLRAYKKYSMGIVYKYPILGLYHIRIYHIKKL